MWQDRAACRGMNPELFFPERGEGVVVDAARAVCAGCEVAAECLEFAIENSEKSGIWGGYSERQRRRIRARRHRERRLAS